MIDSGKTLALAARTLYDNGAKSVHALISHGLLSGPNLSFIDDLPIQELVVRITLSPSPFPCPSPSTDADIYRAVGHQHDPASGPL